MEASAGDKKVKRRRRDPDRGAKILAAARTLFYERGFHAVSVDEIGEAAGATGAAIYRHFSGKEEILSTLFDEALDQYLVAIPDPDPDPLVELEALVRNHVAFTLDHRELACIWAFEDRALTGEYKRRLERRSRQHIDRWIKVMRRAFPERADEDLLSAAEAAIGTASAVVSRPGREISERESAIVCQMLIAGLQTLGEPES